MKKAVISINDIQTKCILGISTQERRQKQEIIISLTLLIDASQATKSDNISDTVNYHTLADKVISAVSTSNFHLLESLVDFILKLCKQQPYVIEATAKVEKPHILSYSKGVSLEMTSKNG